jgi:putative transposase
VILPRTQTQIDSKSPTCAHLSHSRRGECYDNAQAESIWSRLKTELLELRDWPVFTDLADTQVSVADYFDYYNHRRRHSSIGYAKPYHFHQQLLANITQFSPA